MKITYLFALTLFACSLFATEPTDKQDKLSIYSTSHNPHAIDLLMQNQHVSVWCADYCRAIRNQCLQTHNYSYCTAEFVDCVDSCLDSDNSGGGSSGGSGGGAGNPG